MPSLDQIKGRAFENQVLNYFQNRGFHLVAKNYKIGRVEVDLILKKDQVYYIVEVKSDNTWREFSPLSYNQKKRLSHAALGLSESTGHAVRLWIAFAKENQVKVYPLDDSLPS